MAMYRVAAEYIKYPTYVATTDQRGFTFKTVDTDSPVQTIGYQCQLQAPTPSVEWTTAVMGTSVTLTPASPTWSSGGGWSSYTQRQLSRPDDSGNPVTHDCADWNIHINLRIMGSIHQSNRYRRPCPFNINANILCRCSHNPNNQSNNGDSPGGGNPAIHLRWLYQLHASFSHYILSIQQHRRKWDSSKRIY